MALVKETVVAQITVSENGIVLVRENIIVKENGVEISKKYHRNSFLPGQDVSSEPINVQNICITAWTPEVIAAYKNKPVV
jgi:hypothetical protein